MMSHLRFDNRRAPLTRLASADESASASHPLPQRSEGWKNSSTLVLGGVLGPRPPGSDAHDWTYLLIHLSLLGAGVDVHSVEFDSFKASTLVGEIEMTNAIAVAVDSCL